MVNDPYLTLGVTRDATREEITEAYRALAQIYHPDRYADAPPRVQAEANKRMQAVNAAFALVRRTTPSDNDVAAHPATGGAGPRMRQPQQPQRPPANTRNEVVHYVDGSKGYHSSDVAPLGFMMVAGRAELDDSAPQCSRLDEELLRWFSLQVRNASMSSRQLFESWSPQEQASYAARLGCTQVRREKLRSFAGPCPECRP